MLNFLKKYLFVNNFLNGITIVATIISWFFPNLSIKTKFLVTVICVLFATGQAFFHYIIDLKNQLNDLTAKNILLQQNIDSLTDELNKVSQNRNYLDTLLKNRDYKISFYEELLKNIEIFHISFLANPSSKEKTHISKLNNYINEQKIILKEHESNV